MDKARVLFLCTGNSARSQMAEAFLRTYAPHAFEAYSAGLEPKGVHPLTVEVLDELGIDIRSQRSKHLDEYMGKMFFGYLITVCSQADASCPAVFPGVGVRMHWAFDDPAACRGTQAECLQEFRRVRDEIRNRVLSWLEELHVEPART
ncbi:MAG TPA: arsenate reductase ArsC [Deltaproteobacteria bacterium]|nr:arsenate reductase ArsC [Deltaproteobacteria bacterium]HOM28378.1 arsenate reductase ArsC [Deltaproteobacteria bacterium]